MVIAKYMEFEASHQLPNEVCYGACRNEHGHTYKLTIEIEGPINKKGWIMNFKELKALMKKLFFNKWDHNNLNKFFTISTAEIMSQFIFNELSKALESKKIDVRMVKLYETSNSYAMATKFDESVYNFVIDFDGPTHEFQIEGR